MEYKVICEHDETLLKQAADLHYKTLGYRSFITSFGREFLYQIYRGILEYRLGFFIFANSNSKLEGFILGCTDSTKLISIVVKKIWIFSKLIIPALLRNPRFIGKLVSTILYPQIERVKTKGELLVIVVEARCRSKGIGSTLVEKLDDEFSKRGIQEYKVAVHREMTKSNDFYFKKGMKLSKTFNLYNTQWNIYLKNISENR
jgi:ribosomal protein S18 acetylase RimI-like enzyme